MKTTRSWCFAVTAILAGSAALAAAEPGVAGYGYNSNLTVNVRSSFNVNVRNNGADPASGVTLKSTLPDGFEFVPSSHCSAAASVVTCTIGSLAAGAEVNREVHFVPREVAKVTLGFTLIADSDSNPDNNKGSFEARVFPQNTLNVSAGPANPVSREASKGQRGVPVLQISLRNTTVFPAIFDADTKPSLGVNHLFLKASGTGQDARDITAVRVFEDQNGNGAVDAGEPLRSINVFPGDDGTIDLGGLNLEPTSPETRQSTLLVTFDFDSTLHYGALRVAGAALVLGGLLFGAGRRRLAGTCLGAALALSLSACQTSAPPPPPQEPSVLTYSAKLTAVTSSDGETTIIDAALPLGGATISIAR